jgi:hypothetical protein
VLVKEGVLYSWEGSIAMVGVRCATWQAAINTMVSTDKIIKGNARAWAAWVTISEFPNKPSGSN